MSPSEERAVRAVELGIIACEGLLVVDGIPRASYIDAELARRSLAERAVTEAAILRRYIRLDPPCAWCGAEIKPIQESREIDGRLLHDTPELECAREFEGSLDAYEADYAVAHPDVVRGRLP